MSSWNKSFHIAAVIWCLKPPWWPTISGLYINMKSVENSAQFNLDLQQPHPQWHRRLQFFGTLREFSLKKNTETASNQKLAFQNWQLSWKRWPIFTQGPTIFWSSTKIHFFPQTWRLQGELLHDASLGEALSDVSRSVLPRALWLVASCSPNGGGWFSLLLNGHRGFTPWKSISWNLNITPNSRGKSSSKASFWVPC